VVSTLLCFLVRVIKHAFTWNKSTREQKGSLSLIQKKENKKGEDKVDF
jgi:hypothetical protein